MKLKVLVAYSVYSSYVQTTHEYLDSFRRFLDAEVEYLHVTTPAVVPEDLDRYDVIINSYCARFSVEGYVSESYRNALASFKGLKILAVQDEYEHTNRVKSAISTYGFDYVLTCVPQDEIEYVYPKTEFPNVEFVTVLTGYVPDSLASSDRAILPLAERSIVIGYRGRDIGGAYGRLGFQKFEIGRRMREICEARGIAHDIAMDEESRIYGTAWLDFVGRCRTMLGSESGSNVFDFDGSIARQYREMKEANQGRPPTYEEFRPLIEQRDNEINMGQVSPRIFECAVMKTPMILFRGRYSGVVEPNIHYIPLEHDFSNIEEVLQRSTDLEALSAMANRAYEDVVVSGRYGYPAFVGIVRRLIDEGLARRGNTIVRSHALPSIEDDHSLQFPMEAPTKVVGRPEVYFAKEAAAALAGHVSSLEMTVTAYNETCDLAEAELVLAGSHPDGLAQEANALVEATSILRRSLEELMSDVSSFLASDAIDASVLATRSFDELKNFREKTHAFMRRTKKCVGAANARYNDAYVAISDIRAARQSLEGDGYRDAATAAGILKIMAELHERTNREAFTVDSYLNTCHWASKEIETSPRHPSLNAAVFTAKEALKELQCTINDSRSYRSAFENSVDLSTEALKRLDHNEAADLMQRIKDRLDQISVQVPRLNQDYQHLCGVVADLQSLRGIVEANSRPSAIQSFFSKGRFWLRKRLGSNREDAPEA